MKNWGKFFILILIITVLTACGQKGEGGGGTPSLSVPKNERLATLISNNIKEVQSTYNSYYSDDLLMVITSLGEIRNIYINGGTHSQLDALDSQINTSLTAFFLSGNGMKWMTRVEYEELSGLMTLYTSTVGVSQFNSRTVQAINGILTNTYLSSIMKSIDEQKSNNNGKSHYVDINHIALIEENFMGKKVDAINDIGGASFPGGGKIKDQPEYANIKDLTVKKYLESIGLIYDGDRASLYQKRIGVLSYENRILERGSYEDVLISYKILTSSEVKTLSDEIINLISQYRSNSLYINEQSFLLTDDSIYKSIFSNSSNKPNVTGGILKYDKYPNNLVALSNRANSIVSQLKQALSNTTGVEYENLSLVIKKLENGALTNPITRLESYGYLLLDGSMNKGIVYSKAVVAAEFVQILSEHDSLILTYVDIDS